MAVEVAEPATGAGAAAGGCASVLAADEAKNIAPITVIEVAIVVRRAFIRRTP